MEITFRKRHGDYSQLICTRDDGSRSETLFHNQESLPHDLIHYVVETTMGYQQGFYGLVANGAAIAYNQAHNHPIVARQDVIENLQAESLVKAIQLLADEYELSRSKLLPLTEQLCQDERIPTPNLTDKQVSSLCLSLQHYRQLWLDLCDNHQLQLNFQH
ncbi:MAG: hypothetical protein HUJ30_05995 [Gammaproteobacteria bacterium]|nr:hypothetical protein [Gammaproteobacteria bacterium]